VVYDAEMELPITVQGEELAVSATTYVAFRQCPASAVARLRGMYGPESRASFKGTLAHRIFARHLEEGPIDPDAVAQACREEIGKGLNAKLTAVGLKPSELGMVIQEVADLYKRFQALSVEGFRSAEVYIDADAGSRVTLRGRIDAVFDADDGGTRLIDWKTGQLGDAEDQLAFYALAWVANTGDRPSRIEALSVQTGERSEQTPSEESIQATAGAIGNLVDTVRTIFSSGESGERRAGPWCRWCPILTDCTEGRSAIEVYAHG
jgi:RecB family exonuclease